MRFASRTDPLKPEGAYHVLAKAQALEARGADILHLEIGQPDADTFDFIKRAGIQAIEAGHTRYTPPAGLPALRAAIARHAGEARGVEFQPGQVVASPGAKPNLFFPTLALVEPGDEVIYPEPGFPTYPAMIAVAGGVPKPVPLVEEQGFALDLEAFDAALSPRTRLILLNSPSNPTGGVMTRAQLEHVAEAARQLDCWVLSDEIYRRIHYLEEPPLSIVSLPGMSERTIVVDGYSKTYAMTGWRLGYGIMPSELARRVELLITHATGSTAQFTQVAGLAALEGPQDEVERMVARFRARRDLIVEGLNRLPGVRCQTPAGAFYAFPNIQATGFTSEALADRILELAGVALLPGTAFGARGEGFLRVSFAASAQVIEEALRRLESFFARL